MKHFIAIILAAASIQAHAVEFEASIGNTRYLKSNDTDYWQTGPASQGFGVQWKVESPSYTLGLTGKSGNYRWHAYYWNGGNVHMDSMAVQDHDYDIPNQKAKDGAKFFRFVGDQRFDGVYATLGYEFKVSNLIIEPYAGFGLYRNTLTVQVLDSNENRYDGPIDPNQLNLGPVVGVSVGNKNVKFFIDAKYIGRTGAYPGIVQGYAVTNGLKFVF